MDFFVYQLERQYNEKKAILIIGNGHTSSWQNCYKINYNLCQFLSNLKSSNYNLTWAQSMRVEKNITGLNTTEIPKNNCL